MTVSTRTIQTLQEVAEENTEDAEYAKALLYAFKNNE